MVLNERRNNILQPGLLSYKTLVDVENPNNYCVLTKWKSEVRVTSLSLSLWNSNINTFFSRPIQDHLNKWLSDDWYLETTRELDKVSEQPAKYKIFKSPHEDVFLL